MAILAGEKCWGLINLYHLPPWSAIIIGAVCLDFVIYLQHVAFHTVPLCWRLHMLHHTDMDIDMTTGVRFHPVEIVLSMFIKMAAIVILGAPPLAVLIFEVALNGGSIFTHSNAYIPGAVDKALRVFFVTPDMHRVHHSVIMRETNTNFGFNLSWWDRIMGTYQDQPSAGHEAMTIGLGYFRDEKEALASVAPHIAVLKKEDKESHQPCKAREKFMSVRAEDSCLVMFVRFPDMVR